MINIKATDARIISSFNHKIKKEKEKKERDKEISKKINKAIENGKNIVSFGYLSESEKQDLIKLGYLIEIKLEREMFGGQYPVYYVKF